MNQFNTPVRANGIPVGANSRSPLLYHKILGIKPRAFSTALVYIFDTKIL